MGKITSCQIRLFCNSWDGDLLSRKPFNPNLCKDCSERRNANNMAITYGGKNLEEKKKEVASRDDQEIRGGVLEDLVKKALRTTNTGKTSTLTFRGINDDKHGQGVFDAEGIGCQVMDSRKEKERTVHQRNREVDHLTVSPWREDADPILIEKKVGEYHRF